MTENKSLDQLPLLESPSADAELYVIQSGIDYRVKHSALGGLSPLQYNRIWIGDISGQSTTLTTSAIGRALITAEDAEAGRDALDVYSREFWDTLADESTRLTGFGRPRGVVIETDAANRRVSVTVDRPVRWRNQVLDDFQVGVPWLSPQWDEPVDPCGVLYLAYDGTNYTWFESFPGFGNMLIALVYFDDTCTFHYGTRECHGFMDPDAHRGDHFAVGSYIRADGGGDLDDFVVASTTAANRRPSVDALEMWDEDVPTELPALPSGSYTHFRLSGANADATFAPTQGDIVGLVSGVPQRNIFSGGVWTTQDFGTNHYGTVWALAVPVTADSASQAYRFLWIQPQSSGTLTSQRALSPNDVSLGQYGEVSPEFVFFAKIIIRRQGANWTLQSVERISGNRAQQVTSPTAAGLSSVNADEDYFEGLGTPTSELTLRQASPTTGIIPDRLKITQHNLVIGDADTRGSLLATGEKGRALIGLADDAALQAEILARLVDTTIVGTKLEATSTDADSIKTAGSIQALGSTLSEFSSSGNTEISISGGNGNTSSLNLSTGIGNAGRRWFLRRGIESETGSDAGSPFQIWARNDAGDAIDVPLEITRASNQPINLRRITNVLGGTTPAAQSAANAAIGNGTVRSGTQLRSDGTAADAISSAGGISLNGALFLERSIALPQALSDHGRFAGAGQSSLILSASFNAGTFYQAINGSTVSEAGKFVNDNSTHGGAGSALNTTTQELIAAMGRTGDSARYGIEFFIASLDAGSGTGVGRTFDAETLYLMSVNDNALFFGQGGVSTYAAWVRAVGGNIGIENTTTMVVDGVTVTGNFILTTAMGWTHIMVQRESLTGAFTGLPFFCGASGRSVQIAVPLILRGWSARYIHTYPILSPVATLGV